MKTMTHWLQQRSFEQLIRLEDSMNLLPKHSSPRPATRCQQSFQVATAPMTERSARSCQASGQKFPQQLLQTHCQSLPGKIQPEAEGKTGRATRLRCLRDPDDLLWLWSTKMQPHQKEGRRLHRQTERQGQTECLELLACAVEARESQNPYQ